MGSVKSIGNFIIKAGGKMFFRTAMISLLLAGILTGSTGCSQEMMAERELVDRAKAIHERALTLDTHVDIKLAYATAELDPGTDNPKLKCDLVKMNKGEVDGVFLIVYVKQGQRNAEGYEKAYKTAMVRFNAIRRLTGQMYPERCELATSPDDFERISKTGKRAIMIGVENGFAIGQELKKLREFYELGARYVTLTHIGHNDICDSSVPREALGDKKTEHNGLTKFGREVVGEMNRLGMMCDASHISDESFFDLIKVSKAPIIASHSSCRAIAEHPRNLADEQLVSLAKNGGVIQITAVNSFLRPASGVEADVKTFVDHIEHVVKLVGIDYVGIGSDFDGGGGIEGFNDHCEAFNVTIELVRRGYSEEDICKIWSGNFLRVWREVEAIAKEL